MDGAATPQCYSVLYVKIIITSNALEIKKEPLKSQGFVVYVIAKK